VPVFERLEGHEEVVYFNDPSSGLRAIIAIHSTAPPRALGGSGCYPYSSEDGRAAGRESAPPGHDFTGRRPGYRGRPISHDVSKTSVITRDTQVSVNAYVKHSRIKQ
jgi:hypothetical protein